MDRRDQELLNKQLRGLSPPPNAGVLVSMVVTALLVGVALGDVPFSQQNALLQMASSSPPVAIAHLNK